MPLIKHWQRPQERVSLEAAQQQSKLFDICKDKPF
jgi:hypothetical protein